MPKIEPEVQEANNRLPSAIANFEKLPPLCYSILLENGHTIIIKRGESGYYNPGYGRQGEEVVRKLNERLGVTEKQRKAMDVGSCFGWHVPGADPDNY